MNTDALKSIIEDAHKLAKADIAPDLVKPAVETIALRLERLVKGGRLRGVPGTGGSGNIIGVTSDSLEGYLAGRAEP